MKTYETSNLDIFRTPKSNRLTTDSVETAIEKGYRETAVKDFNARLNKWKKIFMVRDFSPMAVLPTFFENGILESGDGNTRLEAMRQVSLATGKVFRVKFFVLNADESNKEFKKFLKAYNIKEAVPMNCTYEEFCNEMRLLNTFNGKAWSQDDKDAYDALNGNENAKYIVELKQKYTNIAPHIINSLTFGQGKGKAMAELTTKTKRSNHLETMELFTHIQSRIPKTKDNKPQLTKLYDQASYFAVQYIFDAADKCGCKKEVTKALSIRSLNPIPKEAWSITRSNTSAWRNVWLRHLENKGLREFVSKFNREGSYVD